MALIKGPDMFTLGVAFFAAIGTFLFGECWELQDIPVTEGSRLTIQGFDTGIATTTIAHESWISYMGHPSKGLTGAVVAVYIAGEAVGALV